MFYKSLFLVVLVFVACKQNQNTEQASESTQIEANDEDQITNELLRVDELDRSGSGIYGRKMTTDFETEINALKANVPSEIKGAVNIIACIDQRGIIMMARMDEKSTDITDMDLQRAVGKIVVKQEFEPKPTAPEKQCGLVKVNFD